MACGHCDALWCEASCEPCGSARFFAAWPYDAATWRRLHDHDSAGRLHEWHGAMIRDYWRTLPESGIACAEWWRNRTYRNHNPIDCGPGYSRRKYGNRAVDLECALEELKIERPTEGGEGQLPNSSAGIVTVSPATIPCSANWPARTSRTNCAGSIDG